MLSKETFITLMTAIINQRTIDIKVSKCLNTVLESISDCDSDVQLNDSNLVYEALVDHISIEMELDPNQLLLWDYISEGSLTYYEGTNERIVSTLDELYANITADIIKHP
jgi:hypothetical protein